MKIAVAARSFVLALSIFQGGTAAASEAGDALVLLKNNMPLLALKTLNGIKNPSSIDQQSKKELKAALLSSNENWKLGAFTWNNKWSSVFSKQVEIAINAWQTSVPKNAKENKRIEALINQAAPNSPEKSWLQWQLAMGLGNQNEAAKAGKILSQIQESTNSAIDDDELVINAARLLFQDRKFEAALKLYNAIPKDSDFWLESVEERAWTHVRMGQIDKALAAVQTLMVPLFKTQVGPEPFFLRGYADLKICDFKAVFKVLKDFKERQRTRMESLDALALSGKSQSVTKLIESLEKGWVSATDLGPDTEKLPRLISRDLSLQTKALRQKQLRTELATLDTLASKGMAISNLKTIKKSTSKLVQETSLQITSRVKSLAQIDLKEMSKMVQKLLLVEIEAIQRMHNPEMTQKVASQSKASHGSDTLSFPNSDEVWLDEIDHYDVNANGCPAKGKASL